VVENRDGMGPYGSKAHGDGSMSVVAPAIANALQSALGVRLHRAPFTPERVWRAMRDRDAGVDPNPRTGIPEWWTATEWTERK
jgi:hypothetical protein